MTATHPIRASAVARPPAPGRRPGAGRLRPALPFLACAALAGASLALPSTPTNDPWAWLVWGREVAALDLDTTAGASWKPLPVLLTAALAPLGEAAPAAWLLVARTGALAAMLLAYRLAARLAGRAAGALAAVALVLTPTTDARWSYYVAHGISEPLLAALMLGAIERHLDGRRAHALALLVLGSLLRPEAWPFLLGYAAWLWPREPRLRAGVAAAAALVPALWFGGDWWGSGDPFTGGGRARGGGALSPTLPDLARAVRRAAEVVAPPVWALAAAAVALERRRPLARALAAGAAAWLAAVLAAAVLDYAAAPRFMVPAGALLSVLAGVGAARLLARARVARGRAAAALAAAALAALATPSLAGRAAGLAAGARAAADRAEAQAELRVAVARAGGAAALLRCPRVTVEHRSGEATGLAWALGAPMRRIERLDRRGRPEPGVVIVHSARGRRALERFEGPRAPLAAAGRWRIEAAGCRSAIP